MCAATPAASKGIALPVKIIKPSGSSASLWRRM
jgi:hypothetical protein